MSEPFLLDPAHRAYAEGRAKTLRPRGWLIALVFAVGFLGAGSIFVVWLGREWWTFARLKLHGADAVGVVTLLKHYKDTDNDSHRAEYAFEVGSDRYSGGGQIRGATYAALREGGPIHVRYLPSDPTVSRSEGAAWQGSFALGIMTAFMAVWLAIPLALLYGVVTGLSLRARLTRDGTLVRGRILDVKVEYDSDNDLNLTLRYSFQPPLAPAAEGTASAVRNDLKRGAVPRAGAEVLVLCTTHEHLVL